MQFYQNIGKMAIKLNGKYRWKIWRFGEKGHARNGILIELIVSGYAAD